MSSNSPTGDANSNQSEGSHHGTSQPPDAPQAHQQTHAPGSAPPPAPQSHPPPQQQQHVPPPAHHYHHPPPPQEQPSGDHISESNKRAALAGQWRTPPLPVFPTNVSSSQPPPQHYHHPHHPPPQHHQPPPAPPAQQPAPQAGQDIAPPSSLPDNSEDYAKALQEAYRRGAEAAAAMAAQQHQHMTPSVSCPNFQAPMAAQPPPPHHPGQPIVASRSEEMAAAPVYAHAPPPHPGYHPQYATHAPPPVPTHYPGQHPPPPPHHQHHQYPGHAPAPPPPPPHHHHHQQYHPPHHATAPPPPQPSYVTPAPAPQSAAATAPPPATAAVVVPPAASTAAAAPSPVPNPLSNMPPPPPKQQPAHRTPAPAPATTSSGAGQSVVPPTQRSVSLPDMTSYAVQAEEEKRQKRLARNRASARLRRLRKKNLVDAYETEVGILEKTLQQLKAHEWGVPTSGPAAAAAASAEKSHQSLLEALCMDRGQQVISSEQRAQQCQDILEQQLQQMEMLRQVQFEQQILAAAAAVGGEQKQDEDPEIAEMAQELSQVLGLSDDQKAQLQQNSIGLEDEMIALDTVFSSLVMMKENEWLLNQGVQDITDQLTSILHKNQMSKFLLWADANVEAIDQLDHVHAAPKAAPHPQGPIFTFGVETTPVDDDGDGK